MKSVLWTDDNGFKRRSLVRDVDGLDRVKQGIPIEFPDVVGEGWEDIAREVANILVEQDMRTYADLMNNPTSLNAVLNVVKRRIITAYRDSSSHS